jgi:IclR family transcriptional regulator, acetate operon repressor
VLILSNNEKSLTTLRTPLRALAFLEAVAQAPRPPKLKDVISQLGLNITTGYHILNTLQQAGYLVRDADATLRIGGRVGILYQGLLRHLDLGRDLHPIVAQLAQATEETAYLCSLSSSGVVVHTLVEGTQAVRVSALYVGFSGSEHIRASGKAVLAFMPAPERAALLTQCMAEMTVREQAVRLATLNSEFGRIRADGWALDDQQFQDSVCCVAAPYFSSDGKVSGSIAVSVPAARFRDTRAEYVEQVQRASRQICEALGYQEPVPGFLT